MQNVLEWFLRSCPAVPGIVAWGIGPDGSGVGHAAGLADPVTGRPLRPDTTFRLASNTKTFAAATALRMAELGMLELDEPAANFLPDELVGRLVIIDGVSHGGQITIRHLLTHCSSVPSVADPTYMADVRISMCERLLHDFGALTARPRQ
jgi:D-alanyl-D-alanine carboxypeptidase